jgi:hypothetical protein
MAVRVDLPTKTGDRFVTPLKSIIGQTGLHSGQRRAVQDFQTVLTLVNSRDRGRRCPAESGFLDPAEGKFR